MILTLHCSSNMSDKFMNMLDMIHQHVGKITDHFGKIMGPTV